MDRTEEFIVYKRVSTQKQGNSGLGLEAQDRDISLFLSTYCQNPEVIAEFTEVQSGAKENRAELQKAVSLAKETGSILLVSKLDRLSRKVSFIASLMDDKRLSIRVAQMPMADKFQLHIYAALAEQEREFISKRTKAAMAEAKRKGRSFGGHRDGQDTNRKALRTKAVENAKRIAPFVLPLREHGATLQEIADRLNAMGIETGGSGGKWYPSSVRNVLNRLQVGRSSS